MKIDVQKTLKNTSVELLDAFVDKVFKFVDQPYLETQVTSEHDLFTIRHLGYTQIGSRYMKKTHFSVGILTNTLCCTIFHITYFCAFKILIVLTAKLLSTELFPV